MQVRPVANRSIQLYIPCRLRIQMSVIIWEILYSAWHYIWLWILRGMARWKKKVALLATTALRICNEPNVENLRHDGWEAWLQKYTRKPSSTQGLRATALSFQDGGCSKMAVSRHIGYYRTGNSAIRSADPGNPCLEPHMEWIGCTVCEIFSFKLYCDLETGVRGHWRSPKVAPWDRPTPKTSY